MPRYDPQRETVTQPKHVSSGEPDDAKVSRPVRRGVCGKVPLASDAAVTRHFPTLLYAVAGAAAGVAFGADSASQGGVCRLQRRHGSPGVGPDGTQDARRTTSVWRYCRRRNRASGRWGFYHRAGVRSAAWRGTRRSSVTLCRRDASFELAAGLPNRDQPGVDTGESQNLAGLGAGTPGSQSGCWEKIRW